MNSNRRSIVGRLILANILEMKVDQYLKYVDRFLMLTSESPFYKIHQIDTRILFGTSSDVAGAVVTVDDEFHFYSPRYIKLNFELLQEPSDVKWKH